MYAQFCLKLLALLLLWGVSIGYSVEAQQTTDSIVKLKWEKFSLLQIRPGSQHYGIQRKDKWVTVCIQNADSLPATYYIRFHNPHLNEIEGFKNFSTTSFIVVGDWFAFHQRPLDFRDFLIPITVPSLKTDSLLFRLNKRGESLSIEYELIPAANLMTEMNMDYVWLGVVVSFIFLVTSLAFFMGFNFKQPLLFIFSLFSMLTMVWQLNNMGFFFQYFWPSNPLWHYKSRTLFSVATTGTYLFLLYHFFRPIVNRLDRNLFIAFALFLVIKLYGVLTAPQVEHQLTVKYIFVLVSGLGLAIFLFYLLYFFIRNFLESRPHRFQLVVFLIYILFILQEVLLQFGLAVFPFSFATGNASFIFFLLQILLMLIGLSVQINQRIKSGHLLELFQAQENERAISLQQFQILENERKRIRRDIHDQLGGLLVSIKLNLSNLKLKFFEQPLHKELDRIRVLVDSSINQLHQVVHDLVPPKVTAENFHELVKNRIRLYEEVSSIQFTSQLNLPAQCPQSLLIHLYRIICELVSNSVQHSQCSAVELSCSYQGSILYLKYSDNGQGFTLENKKEGRGIQNIEDRVTLLKGRILFSSATEGMSCQIEFELN